RSFTILLLTICAVQVDGMAQQSSPWRDPQAIALLEQSLAAMGAGAGPVQDTSLDGQIQLVDGKSGVIKIQTKGMDRLRYEVNFPGQRITNVVNRGKGH